MSCKKIDSYHYCQKREKNKNDYYSKYNYTDTEIKKAKSLYDKIRDFIIFNGEAEELGKSYSHIELNINYREDIGYISKVNADRDIVDVYYYGKTEEEAYYNALIGYEFYMKHDYELKNRKKLNLDYSRRFLDGNIEENDYHGPFFFAELALQDFHKYFGNIPQYIINYYERYIEMIENKPYKYDYSNNCLELVKTKKH